MSTSDLVSLGFVVALSALVIGGALLARRRATDPAGLAERLRSLRWPLALTGSGALIALTGAGMVVHASLVTEVPVDLEAAERGAEVDAAIAVVEGYARPDAILCRRGRTGEQCYTPITSTPDTTTVALLVAGVVRTPRRGRWTGFVTRSEPQAFRSRLEELGLASIPEPIRLLRESRGERSRAGSGVALAGVGLLAVGWLWLRRGRSR